MCAILFFTKKGECGDQLIIDVSGIYGKKGNEEHFKFSVYSSKKLFLSSNTVWGFQYFIHLKLQVILDFFYLAVFTKHSVYLSV